ncbi:IS701 family transposase [Mycobacterium riyadhense]|uniref:IS701 family transposase n=1 Tax=Mycobacterium riyadhense TaxID=486698 RepID=UPI001951C91E|nr:IS701 family transposase [Mycobacterium riyadhense]
MDRIRVRFARYEPARHAAGLMLGLLSNLERKNCWTIAEERGDVTPHGLQHLLSRASWDEAGVAEDLRDYVTTAFADPDAILVVDETGDLKKGTATVGVQRQYTGTAGRIENSQVAVYLTYAGARGHALIDTTLYLPKDWTADRDRRKHAGVPDDVEFATKPVLAQQMITDALEAGVSASWVAGDEVYGADSGLRATCRNRGIGYVLAVARNHHVVAAGTRVDELAAGAPGFGWQKLSAGAGSKGPRLYSWLLIDIASALPGHEWIMVRRNDSTGELAYYRCWSPQPVPLRTLVRVAGRRWTIEESFQAAKGQAGLDEHQVRTWTSWHRWVILSMLALAFLAITTANERDNTPAPQGLIPFTVNEIRRLFDKLILARTATADTVWAWSLWRRKHQATARYHHYQRRSEHQ